jgi:hypothetical protein
MLLSTSATQKHIVACMMYICGYVIGCKAGPSARQQYARSLNREESFSLVDKSAVEEKNAEKVLAMLSLLHLNSMHGDSYEAPSCGALSAHYHV